MEWNQLKKKFILLPLVRKYRDFHELKVHHTTDSAFWDII
jgi:hypothetical protein